MSAQATRELTYEPVNGHAPGDDGVRGIDDGIFVPTERFPLIMRLPGNKTIFDATVNQGKNEKDPEMKKRLAHQAKTSFAITGCFFIAREKFIEAGGSPDEMPPGWDSYTTTMGDKEVEGLATNNLKIAVIRMRRIREIKRKHKDETYGGELLPKKWGWFTKMRDVQKGKYQTRLQVLCYVAGMERLGPIVVTMKTTAVTSMLGNRRDNKAGIFNPLDASEGADSYFYKHVLGPANKEAKQRDPKAKVAQNHYWLELTNAKDKNGFPAWEKIEYGESESDFIYVCPLVWARYQEAIGNRDFNWKALRVSPELAEEGDSIRLATHEWAAAWSDKNIKTLNEVVNQNDLADEADELPGADYATAPTGHVQPLPPELPQSDETWSVEPTDEQEEDLF